MIASARSAANATAAAPSPPQDALSDEAAAPLTRVSLACVEPGLNIYLRFGEPARVVRLDRWHRVAVFLPGSVFCRIHWEGNDYGTVRWQLMVMQACALRDVMQRVRGVRPGARVLLHAEGPLQVRAVLPLIDAIEALGIAPADASPAYWGTLGNRLAARLPLPVYTAATHAAWRVRRALR